MKWKRIMIFAIALVVVAGCATIAFALSNQEPAYKLQENIRRAFRSEWIWDESKKEYTNLGDLNRDPKTGLFPEPSPFPKELNGDAHWDSYLGLYVANSIKIDHQKGTIEDITPTADPSIKLPPHYDIYIQDRFNDAYRRYSAMTREKYYGGGKLSISYPDLDIFEKEGLTPEWFGLTIADLPMLKDKLEAGAPTAYTMSLISLLTKSHVNARPSQGNAESRSEWLKEFETLKSSAKESVRQGKIEELGYLSLPYIQDELKVGDDSLLPTLPNIVDGLGGCAKSSITDWDITKWVNWFESQSDTINMIRNFDETKLYLPWIE